MFADSLKSELALPPNAPSDSGPITIGWNQDVRGRPVDYLLGKITYLDIYSPIQHQTTFCLVAGDQFPYNNPITFHFCSKGNSMD
jgi:hypothetical protein